MGSDYELLLDATIQHLEGLRASGVRHVAVSPETLHAFTLPAPRPGAPAPTTPKPPALSQPKAKPASTSAPGGPPDSDAADSGCFSIGPRIEPPAAIKPALSPEAKAAAFAELRARVLPCGKCPNLASSRKNVVFGVGDIHADLMFVGEAPGADEDTQGEPFVGAAGQLLTKIIQAMGRSRQDVYIANILKCRPDTPSQSSGNRKPTPVEMATCLPYLQEQIDLIQPKVLVALGGTAMEGLLNKTGIMKLRGHWHAYRGIPLMPTYHPSYLLRNQAMSEKRRVWEDMLQVMERLGMTISAKQRNFFTKGAA